MRKVIVILTGEIAAGKSTLAHRLKETFDFKVLSTSDALKEEAKKINKGKIPERKKLISLGEKLDKETDGSWVLKHFQNEINSNKLIVVDSVRIKLQIDAFRIAYGSSVVHLHMFAPEGELEERFLERKDKDIALTKQEKKDKYIGYKKNKTEKGVKKLAEFADLVIDTSNMSKDDNLIHAASFLRLLAPINSPLVDVIVGGQFGSEGKGQVAAYLAKDYDCLVRVGGPNAGHKVYNEDVEGNKNPHVFHLVPSGSTNSPDSKIIIGPGAVLNEDILLDEIKKFGLVGRIIIDQNATIISDDDIKKEKNNKIGGTGQGVGEATARNILLRLQNDDSHKAKNSKKLRGMIGRAHLEYEKFFVKGQKILLEGTQGTFLDLHHGYFPYVTSRGTTVMGCLSEAGIGPSRVRKIIMVTRRYPIRVANPEKGGTSGPFGDDSNYNSEIKRSIIAERSKVPEDEIYQTEKTSTTNKDRRLAEFNWALFRRACELNTATDIAFTFADYINYENQKAKRLDQLTPETIRFIQDMERCAGIPVSLIATRFDYRSIIDRRKWI